MGKAVPIILLLLALLAITTGQSLTARVSSPEDGYSFSHGESISFKSSVSGGTPPYTYAWVSAVDGPIGNSSTFDKNDLSEGDHTIILRVVDSKGATSTNSIKIHILPDSWDWRDATYNGIHGNWTTRPQVQQCGDCWAFATIATMEARYNLQNNNPDLDVNLSEQYLISDCCNAGGCNGGRLMPGGEPFRGSFECDTTLETCIHYQGVTTTCQVGCDDGSPEPVITNADTYVSGTTKANIQHRLIQEGPFAVSVILPPGKIPVGYVEDRTDKNGCPIFKCEIGGLPFCSAGGEKPKCPEGGYPRCDENGTPICWEGEGTPICPSGSKVLCIPAPNHAVTLTGYDNAHQYWIAKNWWGFSPGDPCRDGFDRFDYKTCQLFDRIGTTEVQGVP